MAEVEFDEGALFGGDEPALEAGSSSGAEDSGSDDAPSPLAAQTSAGVDIVGEGAAGASVGRPPARGGPP
jgi:hypothetical protein